MGSLSAIVRYDPKTLPLFTFQMSLHGTDLIGLDLFLGLDFTLLDAGSSPHIYTLVCPQRSLRSWHLLLARVREELWGDVCIACGHQTVLPSCLQARILPQEPSGHCESEAEMSGLSVVAGHGWRH